MNDSVPEFLDNVLTSIDENQFDSVVNQMQDFLKRHPEQIDLRARQEFMLLQKILEYKSAIQDWDDLRTLKWLYHYCEEHYAADEICGTYPAPAGSLPDTDVIWWCWLQGLENAPPIVKQCYSSLKKLGREIRVLTEDSLGQYAKFPVHILKARNEGKISNAHFSDLLRAELLSSRGGCWIDATVLCTGEKRINEILSGSPLFCYRSVMKDGTSEFISYDSWFLSVTEPSAILTDTKNMLYSYWEKEDHLMHYFLFHIFFTLATWRHPDECGRIPIFSTEPCHVMQMELFRPYSGSRFDQLCEMSDIHKLTYKFENDQPLSGTVLQHILSTTI